MPQHAREDGPALQGKQILQVSLLGCIVPASFTTAIAYGMTAMPAFLYASFIHSDHSHSKKVAIADPSIGPSAAFGAVHLWSQWGQDCIEWASND